MTKKTKNNFQNILKLDNVILITLLKGDDIKKFVVSLVYKKLQTFLY